MKKTILIIDDEINILELLKYNLENVGYKVLQSESGEDGLEIIKNSKIDLVVLDFMLPNIDGLEVLKEIRKNDITKNIPVIMLTAKNDEIDKILGLELGADDYLGKPFSIRELIARIKAIIRMSERATNKSLIPTTSNLKIGTLEINENSRVIYKDNLPLNLTLKEFELLKIFITNKNKAFTREDLLEKIWGYEYLGETRTVDVHIRQIRKKIEKDDSNPKYIVTVRGIGYKFIGD